ncbi:hypothetical protein GCM10027275_30870 [Rhabdobacter roseus]
MEGLSKLLESQGINYLREIILERKEQEFEEHLKIIAIGITLAEMDKDRTLANQLRAEREQILNKRADFYQKLKEEEEEPAQSSKHTFDPQNPKLTWTGKNNDVYQVFLRLKSNPRCCIQQSEDEIKRFVSNHFIGLAPSRPVVKQLTWTGEATALYYAFGEMLDLRLFKEKNKEVAIFINFRFGLGVEDETVRSAVSRKNPPKPHLMSNLMLVEEPRGCL